MVPEALQRFARAAADFATHGKLGKLEFAQDAHGRPDVSAFDFTSMMRAESSARVREKHGARLLLGLVGDCLVEVRGQCSLMGGRGGLSGSIVRRHRGTGRGLEGFACCQEDRRMAWWGQSPSVLALGGIWAWAPLLDTH